MVCTGQYPNNFIMDTTWDDAKYLADNLDSANGSIYLEGGDIWYYDPKYYSAFDWSSYFNVIPAGDGYYDGISDVTGAGILLSSWLRMVTLNGQLVNTSLSKLMDETTNFVGVAAVSAGFDIWHQRDQPGGCRHEQLCTSVLARIYQHVGFNYWTFCDDIGSKNQSANAVMKTGRVLMLAAT